jgi:subtilisin family serine protease
VIDQSVGSSACEPLRLEPRVLWHLDQAFVPPAWQTTRGAGSTVAVIDRVIDSEHPEFAGRALPCVHVGDPIRPALRTPHGTKVAGVACAGGVMVCGVAPAAWLLPVNVAALAPGTGQESEATALLVATERGADVICCAWGANACTRGIGNPAAVPSAVLETVMTKGRNGLGCVVVYSAGNEAGWVSDNPYARQAAVVAVGACDANDRHISASNSGKQLWCVFPSGNLAHGPNVATTVPAGSLRGGEAWYTDSFGLTSAAAAGVAGVCALILSANPNLYWWEVKDILRCSSDKIDPENGRYDANGHSPLYGYGRVNAARAVEMALEWAIRRRSS